MTVTKIIEVFTNYLNSTSDRLEAYTKKMQEEAQRELAEYEANIDPEELLRDIYPYKRIREIMNKEDYEVWIAKCIADYKKYSQEHLRPYLNRFALEENMYDAEIMETWKTQEDNPLSEPLVVSPEDHRRIVEQSKL